jgi:hypothetical protein
VSTARRAGPGLTNAEVADVLDRVADLLAAQHASSHRVRAWRRGAQAVRELEAPIGALADRGPQALKGLPGIGAGLASAIEEFTHTGRLASLDRLEGQVSPEDLFATVPGIGEVLAERLHAALDVETLEELEVAAHDGRLARVEGFGERRVQAIRDELAAILGRSARRRARRRRWLESGHGGEREARPAVATLLAVDAEYRARAQRGELRQIAPRRFNPSGEAWLPVLHLERDGWSFTALFSNTARAHELGRTRDWVVIYFERDGEEDQCTVVTERRGPLAGRRVVRGREAESGRFHAAPGAAPAAPSLPG